MSLRHSSLAIVLIAVFASVGYPQTPTPGPGRDAPDFSVQVWGYIAADFSARIASYLELRSKLETGLPALTITDDPAAIGRAERALAKRIRIAREEATQGAIFTPAISVEFRKVLRLEMNAATLADIMEENPAPSRTASTPLTRRKKSFPPCRRTSSHGCRDFLMTSSIVFWDRISCCTTRERT